MNNVMAIRRVETRSNQREGLHPVARCSPAFTGVTPVDIFGPFAISFIPSAHDCYGSLTARKKPWLGGNAISNVFDALGVNANTSPGTFVQPASADAFTCIR